MAQLPERQLRRLITAVAEGDASRQDVVAQLREAGVDSLDVIVEVLAQLTAKGSSTSVGGSLDLVPVGWNDRASSVETW